MDACTNTNVNFGDCDSASNDFSARLTKALFLRTSVLGERKHLSSTWFFGDNQVLRPLVARYWLFSGDHDSEYYLALPRLSCRASRRSLRKTCHGSIMESRTRI
jgi:hypothetical protein